MARPPSYVTKKEFKELESIVVRLLKMLDRKWQQTGNKVRTNRQQSENKNPKSLKRRKKK